MVKISCYTTSRNTLSLLDYPLKECVESLKGFADEIIIADSSDKSDTDTLDLLNDLEKSDKRIKVFHRDLDYTTPNHGVLDGQQKAFSRSKCSSDSDWLYQIDNDEIIHENDGQKIISLVDQINDNKEINVLALPVIEPWGSYAKIRIDVNIWKERISRNLPYITHGIPTQLRFTKDGYEFSKPGSDGCNLIDTNTGNLIPIVGFMSKESEMLRQMAVKDSRYVSHFEDFFNDLINNLPPVHHFSWFSIERKIRTYKSYWSNHWQSLGSDTINSDNMFFDVPWEQVSDDMIKAKAKELKMNTGGHVFHSPWRLGMKTNSVKLDTIPPEIMKDWIKRNTNE